MENGKKKYGLIIPDSKQKQEDKGDQARSRSPSSRKEQRNENGEERRKSPVHRANNNNMTAATTGAGVKGGALPPDPWARAPRQQHNTTSTSHSHSAPRNRNEA